MTRGETPASETTVLRLCAASFLSDLAHFLVFGAIPFQVVRLGAGPVALGLLPTLFAATYVGTSILAGSFSDRVDRIALLRVGLALFGVATLAIAASTSVTQILALVAVTGIALGLFWSPAQAALSDAVPPRELPKALAKFNVAWGTGKGAGFLLAGAITFVSRPEIAVLSALAPILGAWVLLPRATGGARSAREPNAVAPHSGAPAEIASSRTRSARNFVFLAWGANAIAYGVSSTLNVHAPALLASRGESSLDFGVFLAIVFVVQAACFAALARRVPDRASLLVAHGLGAFALGVFLVAPSTSFALLAAVPLGLSLALAYQASLHASLHRDEGRGFAAGIHEAVLGVGSSLVPLAGGALISGGGRVNLPFVFCLAIQSAAFGATLLISPKEREESANSERPGSARERAAP